MDGIENEEQDVCTAPSDMNYTARDGGGVVVLRSEAFDMTGLALRLLPSRRFIAGFVQRLCITWEF